jgi:hypothetical protein
MNFSFKHVDLTDKVAEGIPVVVRRYEKVRSSVIPDGTYYLISDGAKAQM